MRLGRSYCWAKGGASAAHSYGKTVYRMLRCSQQAITSQSLATVVNGQAVHAPCGAAVGQRLALARARQNQRDVAACVVDQAQPATAAASMSRSYRMTKQ